MNWKAIVAVVGAMACTRSGSSNGVSGTYDVKEVNGPKVPAVAWIDQGKHCEIWVNGGTLTLDNTGKWTSELQEKTLCNEEATQDTARFTGTYTSSGNNLALRSENGTDSATVDGTTLRVTVVGVGAFEGQKVVYRLTRR